MLLLHVIDEGGACREAITHSNMTVLFLRVVTSLPAIAESVVAKCSDYISDFVKSELASILVVRNLLNSLRTADSSKSKLAVFLEQVALTKLWESLLG